MRNDSQIYFSFDSNKTTQLLKIQLCLTDVKSEAIIIGPDPSSVHFLIAPKPSAEIWVLLFITNLIQLLLIIFLVFSVVFLLSL